MKIIIKNGTMEFMTAEAYRVQSQTINNVQESWFQLLTPAVSGQTFRVKIVSISDATWTDSTRAVIGFTNDSITPSADPNRKIIGVENVGTEYQITLTDDFVYWYVYIPHMLQNYDVTVEI